MSDKKNNSGNFNSGNLNSGDWNSGDWNSGNLNSGDWNSGNRNSGNLNSGNRNSGNLNSGDWNSGDWNSGNRNSGFFCTETPSPTFFDRPVDGLSWNDAYDLIPFVDLTISCEWVDASEMTDAEKESNPSHKTTGGFLRSRPVKIQDAFTIAWKTLNIETKQRFLSLPNFDADKFLTCTGVDVRLDADLFPTTAQQKNSTEEHKTITIDGVTYRLVRV